MMLRRDLSACHIDHRQTWRSLLRNAMTGMPEVSTPLAPSALKPRSLAGSILEIEIRKHENRRFRPPRTHA
jgi:hypothetical protein